MALSVVTRCRVPKDLESVTSINRAEEVNPRSVGVDAGAVEGIWDAVQRLYRSGIHPAIQLCVRRHGEVLIDRAIGHAVGNGPDDPRHGRKVPATYETPFNIYSASKAITAMVIHLLDQRRLLHLNDPVSEYIPEFGCQGKDTITIQHVLTHRAGVPNLPPEVMRLETLEDDEEVVRIMCAATPAWRPGRRLAYHAITGGFILAEIVKRVTGKNIRTVLKQEILQPLGLRWTNYGVAPRDVSKVALAYFTGPPLLPPLSTLLARALGVPMDRAIAISNDPRFLTAVVPAGNVVSTANELSRFYQLLLNGGTLDGTEVFEPRTIRRATQEHSYLEFDLTLVLPLRYGMGFMLGGKYLSLYGPDTPNAFGHLGFTNIISWADPDRQVAGALMTSGKPVVYPEMYYLHDIMWRIGSACKKTGRRAAVRQAVRRAGMPRRPRSQRRAGAAH
jgi:CubicO group peptidase (beta-lactamase class C family)